GDGEIGGAVALAGGDGADIAVGEEGDDAAIGSPVDPDRRPLRRVCLKISADINELGECAAAGDIVKVELRLAADVEIDAVRDEVEDQCGADQRGADVGCDAAKGGRGVGGSFADD